MKKINETTIRNCTFSDNIAKTAGAIYILARPGKTTLIDDCIFMANKAVIYEEGILLSCENPQGRNHF